MSRRQLSLRNACAVRHAVRLAAGSSLVLGLVGLSSAFGSTGSLPAGAIDAACSPTSSTSGQTTTLTFTVVGTCDWTPPAAAGTITVTLWGANGGAGSPVVQVEGPNIVGSGRAGLSPHDGPGTSGAGGQGSEVTGTITGVAGTPLEFNVGGAGTTDPSDAAPSNDGGSNGGGSGTFYGGGGGGASDLRAGSFGATDRILVAGGGGGGGSPEEAASGGNGGNGDTMGGNGADAPSGGSETDLGGGGGGGAGNAGANNGGAAGTIPGDDECEVQSFPGLTGTSDGTGGNGSGAASGPTSDEGGGGGGGGYFGGGGGGDGAFETGECDNGGDAGDGGGGGGSSYTGGADGFVPSAVSPVTDPASPNTPNGEIQVSYGPATTTATTVPTTPTTTPAAAAPVTLAVTGVNELPLVAGGTGLIAFGAVLLGATSLRRRKRTVPTP